jgi:hypothetical protein
MLNAAEDSPKPKVDKAEFGQLGKDSKSARSFLEKEPQTVHRKIADAPIADSGSP